MSGYLSQAKSVPYSKRHWCACSESFTGFDALLSFLDRGWQVRDVVYCQEYWYFNRRRNNVYHFHLYKGNELLTMRVINSPHVLKFIAYADLRVLFVYDRAAKGAVHKADIGRELVPAAVAASW